MNQKKNERICPVCKHPICVGHPEGMLERIATALEHLANTTPIKRAIFVTLKDVKRKGYGN